MIRSCACITTACSFCTKACISFAAWNVLHSACLFPRSATLMPVCCFHTTSTVYSNSWVLQYEVATVLQYEVATVLQYEVATVLQYEVATVLQYEVATVLQYEVANALFNRFTSQALIHLYICMLMLEAPSSRHHINIWCARVKYSVCI